MERATLLGILLSLVFGASALGAHWSPQQDIEKTYRMELKRVSVQEFMGNKQRVVLKLDVGVKCKVVEVSSEGWVDLGVQVHSLKLSHKSPVGDFSFDSSEPADGPEAKFFRRLISGNFIIRLSPQFRVVHVQGWDQRFRASEDFSPALARQYQGLLGEEQLRGVLVWLAAPLMQMPKKETTDVWTHSQAVSAPYPVFQDLAFMATGQKSEDVKISGSWSSRPQPPRGQQTTASSFSGRGGGTFRYEAGSWWPLEVALVDRVKGSLAVELEQGKTILVPVRLESSLTIRRHTQPRVTLPKVPESERMLEEGMF